MRIHDSAQNINGKDLMASLCAVWCRNLPINVSAKCMNKYIPFALVLYGGDTRHFYLCERARTPDCRDLAGYFLKMRADLRP